MGASAVRRRPVELEVVIPAFNEVARLPGSLRSIVGYLGERPYSASVTVVDNNSSDGTARVAAAAGTERVPVHVLRCREAGKGAAVRRGVLASRARFVGFTDADLASPIETLELVLPVLRAGTPVVIGSRRMPGARYEIRQTARRRLGGWAFRAAAELVVPGVSDTQCGFKFFEGRAARALFSDCRTAGFAFDVEILARARDLGLAVAEVPVAWSDQAGSSFQPLRHGLESVAELARIAGRRRSIRTLLTRPAPLGPELGIADRG